MIVRINKDVFTKFHPQLKIACILVKKMDNQVKLKESLHLLRETEELIRLSFNKNQLKTHLLISPWAVAQEKFGKKAKHYHTSIERLLKKVLRKKRIATKDTLTNLVHFISLKHIIPLAVDDLEKISGSLTFSLAAGKEKVGPLQSLKPHALYYRDGKGVLGTKLDYWKSKRTQTTNKSTSALIHLEALPPITAQKLNQITKELADLIQTFCNGKTKVFTLSKKKNSIKI